MIAAYTRARSEGGRFLETQGARRHRELELQARVFSGELGVRWTGEDGEAIEVVHFGVWNREPGPDFRHARLRIGDCEIEGDIELDWSAGDWDAHGHSVNPAFDNVVLHLFVRRPSRRFYTRTSDQRSVPQVCLSLDQAVRGTSRAGHLETLDGEQAGAIIEAAARFRLERKRARFGASVALSGKDEALFQAIAAGLGYKTNKIPFLLVAQRAGLARSTRPDGEALLFGLAGFLQARDFDEGGGEVRAYLRGLWEDWWNMRDREARLVLPGPAWNLASLRPANHPHRRLGALARVGEKMPALLRAVENGKSAHFEDDLRSAEHFYWNYHASLNQEPLGAKTALIGPDRARDLTINAFFPALASGPAWEGLIAQRGPAPSQRVLATADWLCGERNSRYLSSAMIQQGLLQICDDFPGESPRQIWELFEKSR